MTFNYFYNKSILGKKPSAGGITNLLSHPSGSSVIYVSQIISDSGTGGITFTNNAAATSSASINGLNFNDIAWGIDIVYTATSTNVLNWSHSASTEDGPDVGYLYLNGQILSTVSGISTSSGSTAMRNGSNTISLQYFKDVSASGGSDTVTATWTFA